MLTSCEILPKVFPEHPTSSLLISLSTMIFLSTSPHLFCPLQDHFLSVGLDVSNELASDGTCIVEDNSRVVAPGDMIRLCTKVHKGQDAVSNAEITLIAGGNNLTEVHKGRRRRKGVHKGQEEVTLVAGGK